MTKRAQLMFRVIGALVGAAVLSILYFLLLNFFPGLLEQSQVSAIAAIVALVGFVIGAIVGPQPIQQAQVGLTSLSAEQLAGTTIGIMLGLFAGALIAIPLSFLPSPMKQILPIAAMLSFAYLGGTTLKNRPHDLTEWLSKMRPAMPASVSEAVRTEVAAASNGHVDTSVLLDTSVIIDGRITDISKTGFLNAVLSVPNFVLTELQHIADSPDPIRRKRGRRGLEVLNVLRNDCPIPFEITDMDVSEVREVDSKLVALARHLNCPIMTNDYNLNRVAGLQGVTVLNINDLANAVKAAHLPGEELLVKVIQDGREHGQGVGYLDDGTMVVVEDGRNHMNASMSVVVTKVLQTSAGRMIFAKVPD